VNLAHHLARQAASRPDAPALVEGTGRHRRVTTFADLDARAAATAARLTGAGLRAGDWVLVATRLSADLYALLGGLFRAGLVAVVPDVTAGWRGLREALRRVPVRALVLPDGPARLAQPFGARRGVHVFGLSRLMAPGVPGPPPVPVEPAHPALLTFTSGSTGRDRVVVRTHGLLAAQLAAVRAALGLAPGQVDLATLPVFVLAGLAEGVTTVLPAVSVRRPGRVDAPALLRQMRAEGVTRLTASPALVARLVAADRDGVLAGLRHLYTGGGPVFPDLLDALGRAAPSAVVAAVYGSTEAEPIAHLSLNEVTAADAQAMQQGGGLLAGVPVPEVRVALVRPDLPGGAHTAGAFAAAQVPAGEAGEVVVTGAHVVPGYLDGEGHAEAKLDVAGTRWHRTGDLARADDRGRLWLLGRVAAHAPGAPYPFAVEAAARAVPGVRRAALVVLDGEVVLAFEGDAAPERLRAALAWARLDRIVPLRRLPLDRRHNAKVDLPALRRSLARKT
jgi:olefin beta-lactone synthetase